jgi:LysR family transcriptional regulator, chromosome initiation inhibitor
MFPNTLAAAALKDGAFVRVADEHLDVPLYWQCWKLDSPIVSRTTDAVRSAASELRPGQVAGHRRSRRTGE